MYSLLIRSALFHRKDVLAVTSPPLQLDRGQYTTRPRYKYIPVGIVRKIKSIMLHDAMVGFPEIDPLPRQSAETVTRALT
jgi:hypothetical protein